MNNNIIENLISLAYNDIKLELERKEITIQNVNDFCENQEKISPIHKEYCEIIIKYIRILININNEKFEDALKEIDETILHNPELQFILATKLSILNKIGEYEKANEIADKISNIKRTDKWYKIFDNSMFYNLACHYNSRGDIKCIEFCDVIINENDYQSPITNENDYHQSLVANKKQPYLLKIYYQYIVNNNRDAYETFIKILDNCDTNEISQFTKLSFGLGDNHKTLNDIDRAINLVHSFMDKLELDLKKKNLKISDSEEYIFLFRKKTLFIYRKCIILLYMGNYEEALDLFEYSQHLESSILRRNNFYSLYYFITKDIENTYVSFEDLRFEVKHEGIFEIKVESFSQTNNLKQLLNYNDEESSVNEIIIEGDEFEDNYYDILPTFLKQKALLCIYVGKYNEAISVADRLLLLNKDDSIYIRIKTLAYIYKNDLNSAEYYFYLLPKRTIDPRILYTKALFYEKSQSLNEALNYYRKSLMNCKFHDYILMTQIKEKIGLLTMKITKRKKDCKTIKRKIIS